MLERLGISLQALAALNFCTAFLVSLFILPRLAHLASSIGLLDKPGRRKVHLTPRALVGGIGMALAVAFSGLLYIPLSYLRGFYAGAVMLVVIGFFDDFRELHHRWKFVFQVLASLLFIYFSQAKLVSFGDLLSTGPITFHSASVFLTIIGTVGVINALNMIDGLDGLAGGIALVAFACFAALAALDNRTTLLLLSVALCGAVAGFLRFNWHPSTLFMGDAGSLFLGYAAAFLSISITQKPGALAPPVVPLLILAVPITDTLIVMTKRIMKGKSPFYADKTHLHHVLLRLGLSKRITAAALILLSAAFGLLGVAGTVFRYPEHLLFGIFAAYFITAFASSFFVKKLFMAMLEKKRLHQPVP